MPKFNEGWRSAGVLLHPSSLCTNYGIGDLGPSAHKMAEFIKKSGLHFWQVLPLTPTSPGLGNSPYSSFSAFAGHKLLISPELMARDGWLQKSELESVKIKTSAEVDYDKVVPLKNALIDLAFQRHMTSLFREEFENFCWQNGSWMNDFAFFMAAKNYFGGRPWVQWPQELKRREDTALKKYGIMLEKEILREKFAQFIFFRQLNELKEKMRALGIGLIGDAAIYINHDSSDVWAQQHLFKLDPEGSPTAVAGVPPDYFAKDGQLWGNPLFNWPIHQHSHFDWWKHRLWYNFKFYDWVRLDHFRAFAAYWQVPQNAATAAGGSWQHGPGAALFEAASQHGHLNIIAEDLGFITPDVTELRQRFNYPGMRVLQFAFGPEYGLSLHAPFRIEADNVVYPATHDNNTTRGWFRKDLDEQQKKQLNVVASYKVDENNVAWTLIKMAWMSPGALAVASMQDFLNLDEAARMNTPGTPNNNWRWRLKDPSLLNDVLAEQIAELGVLSGRDNQEHPNILSYS